MSSPLRILVAKRTAAVATQLADLGRETFQATYGGTTDPANIAAYVADTFGPAQQLAELQDPDTVFLLALMQQDLVGYAKLRTGSELGLTPGKTAADRLEIERLYVQEDWIGTGLGATLMRRTLEEARARGCRSVVLGVWEQNERALTFYKRLGFKEIDTHPFQLGNDTQNDLVLRKGL